MYFVVSRPETRALYITGSHMTQLKSHDMQHNWSHDKTKDYISRNYFISVINV